MPNVKLKCKECNKIFYKSFNEYNRQIKLGRTKNSFLCSLSCAGIYGGKNMSQDRRNKLRERSKGNTYGKANRQYDIDFYYYIKKIKDRERQYGTSNIDETYLKSLWNKQNGLCALSKIKINLRKTYQPSDLTTASLDRINSQIGYVKDNVQFVAYGINLAKNNHSDEELIEFLQQIKMA